MSINAALTTLAQRELGPGYLVRVTDKGHSGYELVELLGRVPDLDANGITTLLSWSRLSYDELAASELSICGQRRKALEALIADQLEAAA